MITVSLITMSMTTIGIPLILVSCDERRPNTTLRITKFLAWVVGIILMVVGSGMFAVSIQ